MTDAATNPGDGEAMPEVVDTPMGESEGLDSIESNQDEPNEDGEGDEPEGDEPEGEDPEADLEEVEFEGKAFKAPKGIKEALLRQADYTRKTQEVAEVRRAVDTERQELQQRAANQAAFAAEIAKLGALNGQLEPYLKVEDWGQYIRTGGAAAQADYADFQALTQQRDAFARALGQKVQERTAEEQRERARLIEAGRTELAKHIPGYTPEVVSKLVPLGERFGFSPEEIREAESDPRSIRILHRLNELEQREAARKRASTIAQGQKTRPAQTLSRGAGGRIAAKPDTDDFAAFERLADERLGVK